MLWFGPTINLILVLSGATNPANHSGNGVGEPTYDTQISVHFMLVSHCSSADELVYKIHNARQRQGTSMCQVWGCTNAGITVLAMAAIPNGGEKDAQRVELRRNLEDEQQLKLQPPTRPTK